MKIPTRLYRYRPLEEGLIERELEALRDSYLYAPPFAAMNDPMEAFYETGGPGDRIIDSMLAPTGGRVDGIYEMLTEMIDRVALVSFAGTHEDLPMWAYYASNFGGMCLEFDTSTLAIGDFQNEQLRKVTYARHALPPLTLTDTSPGNFEEAVIARISRKRIEWEHEREWRFIVGQVGKKHYIDEVLRRVFLGPRIKPGLVDRICEELDRRPVEVMQGEIHGFELHFRMIKPARTLEECERVGSGRFESKDQLWRRDELEAFLDVSFDSLIEECRRTALHPNVEEVTDFDISWNRAGALYIMVKFKLRSERDVYHKQYYDSRLHRLESGI